MAKKKQSKVSRFFTAVVCLFLGVVIGCFGNLIFTMPDSYEIPAAVTGSTYEVAAGDLSVEQIKEKDLSIHFLELGNKYTGDCTFIKVGDTEVLIDAGSKTDSIPVIKNYISQYVVGKLDYVIITHAHEDHYAGFATNENTKSLFDEFEIGTIIDFAETNKTESNKMYKNYLRERGEAEEKGAKHFTALQCWNSAETSSDGSVAAKKFNLSADVELEILYQKFYEIDAKTENNYSVCAMINQTCDSDTKHYLFTGDLEKDGETSLVASNDLPEVDVYKAGHHGSKTSSSDVLLSEIKPKVVCVCCCAGSSEYTAKNENQFPTQEFVNNVFKYTTKVYVTTLCENYQENKFTSMNGNIVVFANKSSTSVAVSCSNNNTLLKDTDWFKNNRTMPAAA